MCGLVSPSRSWSEDVIPPAPLEERHKAVSLADAAVRALQNNLDISISRHTKESRLTDIVVEQAKFDPTVSVNGQYLRTVDPLNRPVFGATGFQLNRITKLDQRNHVLSVDAATKPLDGGTVDVSYRPARNSVNQDLAEGFLFNPAWTGGLTLTFNQPLLKNAGISINPTFIKAAQKQCGRRTAHFRDRVLTVIASVEQNYWELVFARENVKVAQAALKAAEELLANNRAKPRQESCLSSMCSRPRPPSLPEWNRS
ncbi:MAG: hypothetical protein A4E19_09030 [Nitrospira sp. SG-bin1]|nr:MAG: hypothetical protein A4E19_09030 [Nitrospira sp. SG-bin1]